MASRTSYYSQKLYAASCNNDVAEVEALLRQGADVDYVEPDWKTTPLHCAAINGHREIVILLLQRGANLEVKDGMNLTPMECLRNKIDEHDETPALRHVLPKPVYMKRESLKKMLNFFQEYCSEPKVTKTHLDIIHSEIDAKICYVGISAHATHRLKDVWDSSGSLEWQVRTTEVGAFFEETSTSPHLWNVTLEDKSNRDTNPDYKKSLEKPKVNQAKMIYPRGRRCLKEGYLEAGSAYKMRCRLKTLENYQGDLKTEWSAWSAPITFPHASFVPFLRRMALEKYVSNFAMLAIYEPRDFCTYDKGKIEKDFRSFMDFRERRLLHSSVQGYKKEVRYRPPKHLVEQCDEVHWSENVSLPLRQFLESIGLGLYFEDMVIFCESMETLLYAYDSQEELIDDLKEVLPEMKPAHRRILWKNIRKTTAWKRACKGQ
eukprot:g1851.t1